MVLFRRDQGEGIQIPSVLVIGVPQHNADAGDVQRTAARPERRRANRIGGVAVRADGQRAIAFLRQRGRSAYCLRR